MAEHRLDDGAVRHYQGASLPCGNLPQRRQHPFQQFGIALPFRRAGAQAVGGVRLVGMGPQRRDLFPAMAFPYAKTNLPQPLYRLGFYPQARTYDGRRLGRTFLRAGIEPPEGYAGLFQPAGQRPGLCPPGLVQTGIGLSLDLAPGVPVGLTVAGQKELHSTFSSATTHFSFQRPRR